VRTVETLPSYGASMADESPPTVRHGPRRTVRVVCALAATLAFGLVGLLVAVWQLRRAQRRPGPACPGCRRRGRLVLAGTFALAGLVVVGSGMDLHQQLTGPRLAPCDNELPARVTPGPVHSLGAAAGRMWGQTRQALTAPISGLARHYLTDRGAGLCQGRSMTLAFLPSAASDSSVSVGSIVLAGDGTSPGKENWKAVASHESRHVTQWAILTLTAGPLTMPVLYAADDAFFPQSRNHFERAAGLADGGYPHPEDFGPRPNWPKVGAIAMLLLIGAGRRLRWASRVLTGGAAAAAGAQPGCCPLHSRGWFRLETAS
jgi:hypothetical protein